MSKLKQIEKVILKHGRPKSQLSIGALARKIYALDASEVIICPIIYSELTGYYRVRGVLDGVEFNYTV